jgi:hypothetical protein
VSLHEDARGQELPCVVERAVSDMLGALPRPSPSTLPRTFPLRSRPRWRTSGMFAGKRVFRGMRPSVPPSGGGAQKSRSISLSEFAALSSRATFAAEQQARESAVRARAFVGESPLRIAAALVAW